MRILLVEDDRLVGKAVQQALLDAAYALDWVQDGETALSALSAQEYGLMLLDLGLPRKDGLEVLRHTRKAQHYLVKPFAIHALLARIRAVTRRHQGIANPILGNGVLELNPATREVTQNGQTTPLSAREYALLHALMLRPGTLLSRTELEERIYGWNEEVESNAVEFLIHSLRKKLGAAAIKNVRGIGWMVAKEA